MSAAIASAHAEVIGWVHHTKPDSDTTVLVTLDGDDEPVWFGFWDGESWIDAATGGEFSSQVVSWSPMPAGFNPKQSFTTFSPSVIEQLEAIGQQRLPL